MKVSSPFAARARPAKPRAPGRALLEETMVVTSGDCSIDSEGCATSPNYPSDYGNNEQCEVSVPSGSVVSAVDFETEHGYDFLNVNGAAYSSTSGPVFVAPLDTVSWISDGGVTTSGWKLCPSTMPSWTWNADDARALANVLEGFGINTTDSHPCQWPGVRCKEQSPADLSYGLDLSSRQLTGPIPP